MRNFEKTTDHLKIRQWIDAHGGVPSDVEDTGSEESESLLHVHFSEDSSYNDFKGITWEEFFNIFERNELAFLYQEDERGKVVCKFEKR